MRRKMTAENRSQKGLPEHHKDTNILNTRSLTIRLCLCIKQHRLLKS